MDRFSSYQRTSLNIDGFELRVAGIGSTLVKNFKFRWILYAFEEIDSSYRYGRMIWLTNSMLVDLDVVADMSHNVEGCQSNHWN